MALNVVVIAAGKGTRMKSERPKVLHALGGRPLLRHVLDTVGRLDADHTIVVTGHGADEVEEAVAMPGVQFVRQQPQRGTGHAVQQAVPSLRLEGTTLILNGDVPLVTEATACALVQACRAAAWRCSP